MLHFRNTIWGGKQKKTPPPPPPPPKKKQPKPTNQKNPSHKNDKSKQQTQLGSCKNESATALKTQKILIVT